MVYVTFVGLLPCRSSSLLSLPSRTKRFMAARPVLQALLLQFLSGKKCFLQGRVTQFCLKISLWCSNVVSDWKCWTSSSLKMQGGLCGAGPVLLPSWSGDAGAGLCNLNPKTYLMSSYEQQYFQGRDPFFPPLCSFNYSLCCLFPLLLSFLNLIFLVG